MADLGFEVDTAARARTPRRWLRPLLMIVVPAALVAGGAWLYIAGERSESTDNAYVQQDKVTLSAEVGGVVTDVLVAENQRVNAGDVLFRLDPRPFRIALREADAELARARVDIGTKAADVTGAGVDIAAARAELALATSEFERQSALLTRGFTTRAALEQAELTVARAREKLNTAATDATRARSALASGGAPSGAPAAIEAALARRERALWNLSRTEVRAPVGGIVSQTDRLQAGSMLPAGLPALAIVADGRTWIEANFKETQLKKMAPGQRARIRIDAYGIDLDGRVASIGAGTGAEFALLPAQNANGNWVKVTQRVPVRIAIDAPSPRPLIAGLSGEVTVDVTSVR
jgi:membrane fusion protein (multidrug efflux system)